MIDRQKFYMLQVYFILRWESSQIRDFFLNWFFFNFLDLFWSYLILIHSFILVQSEASPLYGYYLYIGISSNSNHSRYIQVLLISPLLIGIDYRLN